MSDTLGKPRMHVAYSGTTSDGTVITYRPSVTRLRGAVTHLVVGSHDTLWERDWHILRYTTSEESAQALRHDYMRHRQPGYRKIEVIPVTPA